MFSAFESLNNSIRFQNWCRVVIMRNFFNYYSFPIDIEYLPPISNDGFSIYKRPMYPIVLWCYFDFTVLIDKTPLSVNFYGGKTFTKTFRIFIFVFYNHFAFFINVT